MYPTLTDAITGFGGVAQLSDGTSSCTHGATTQNSAALLTSNIGAAQSTPVNSPPTVAITSPVDGSTVPLIFDVTVNATAASGLTIAHVDITVGTQMFSLTSAPYMKAITAPAAGSYKITAIAYDSSGATSTATATVTAMAGAMPQPSASPTPSASPSPTNPNPNPTPTNPSGKPVGAACSDASECAIALCESGVCSEHCDPSNASSCPAQLMCTSTSDDGDLCLPMANADSGCSAVPTSRQADAWPLVLALAMVALRFGVRRRARQ